MLLAAKKVMLDLVQTEFDRQPQELMAKQEANTTARLAEQTYTNQLIQKEKKHDANLKMSQRKTIARNRILQQSLATLKQLKEKTRRRKWCIN